jgi:hypothetical protein
MHEI